MSISTLQISGSALTAERTRLDVISQNIANAQTTRGADGRTYCRRQVMFETVTGTDARAGGVHVTSVVNSDETMPRIYNPTTRATPMRTSRVTWRCRTSIWSKKWWT
jgi:flagellar basal-body rod protein FlgC